MLEEKREFDRFNRWICSKIVSTTFLGLLKGSFCYCFVVTANDVVAS